MYTSSTIPYDDITIVEKVGDKAKRGVVRYDVCVRKDGKDVPLQLAIEYPDSDTTSGVFTTGVQKGNKHYPSDRHTIPLLIDVSNIPEKRFLDMLLKIHGKIEGLCRGSCKSCVREYDDRDGNKRSSIWCNLIESNSGTIYTTAYNTVPERLDPRNLISHMRIRVCIRLSLVYVPSKGCSVRASVSEICVIETIAYGYKLLPGAEGRGKEPARVI